MDSLENRLSPLEEGTVEAILVDSSSPINVGKVALKLEKIMNQVIEAINNGAISISDIEGRTGVSYSLIRKCSDKYGIELPKRGRIRQNDLARNSDIVEFAMQGRQGRSLREVGRYFKLTAERIRQVIDELDMHDAFIMKRSAPVREGIQRKKELSNILGFIDLKLKDSAKQNGWAYEKAVEYITNSSRNRLRTHSFDEIVHIFEAYETALKNGVKLSLEELAVGTGFNFAQVGTILSDVHVSPMHGDNWKGRIVTPEYKKEAILRGDNFGLSSSDISYFVGLPYYTVSSLIRKNKKSSSGKTLNFGKNLTVKSASEIYEARDAGFTFNETCELLDLSPKVVGLAVLRAIEIESQIVNYLRFLYGDGKITKPYRKTDF